MKEALKQAQIAKDNDEIPIGAIIVEDNRIISKGYNMVEKLQDVTAHAEIIALTSAFAYRKTKYLPESRIYITLDPCPMCRYALQLARINEIYCGAEKKISTQNKIDNYKKMKINYGILQKESEKLLNDFFNFIRL